jgi:asparagine synthase (glutamine-hydrolysing)
MDRFVAIIWDQEDRPQQSQVNAWSEALRRQSPKWVRVLDAPGLRVFSYHHRGDGPVVTRWDGENGIVIGVLFERGEEKKGRVQKVGSGEARRVIASQGDRLIRNYWGNYVALWRDAEKRETTVLRDPCGAVPCFMTRQNGVQLLFAHAEDVADLPGVSWTIDWQCLQAFILFNYFVTEHTGLREVKELLAGERMKIGDREAISRSWAWSGVEIAAHPNTQSAEDARVELREAAEACFGAWGNECGKIVVSVSGGLDSSIMVNLLSRESGAAITGIHYVGVGYEGYEVKLARMAAKNASVDLMEVEQDPARDDVRRILRADGMARPKQQLLAVLIDDLSVGVADCVGARCFMIGQGGDNLFITRHSARYVAADYLRLRGPGAGFWRAAYESASLHQQSVWKGIGDGFQAELLGRRWRPFEILQSEAFVKNCPMTEEAVLGIPQGYLMHPWFADASRLPLAKGEHLGNIVALQNYYVDHWRGIERDVIYPYISQPIVEFCLRTPTFDLIEGGADRGLQRSAFADIIPVEVRRRTAKGGANYYSMSVMQANLGFYRDLVANGSLIKQAWFDSKRMQRIWSPEYVAHGGANPFMKRMAIAEAWLSRWSTTQARSAA